MACQGYCVPLSVRMHMDIVYSTEYLYGVHNVHIEKKRRRIGVFSDPNCPIRSNTSGLHTYLPFLM